jgi:hypothetical protein
MVELMKFEDGEYGPRAVITSAWSPEMARVLVAHRVLELELNDGKGWHGNDLSFLRELPQLRAFTLIDYFGRPSEEPIHFLHELRRLEVMTYSKTGIRFSEFPQLEVCSLEWRPKCESLFSCTKLRKLFLNRHDETNVDAFSNLTMLEWLGILNAPIENVLGLRRLERLKYLRLAGLRRLTSLAGIERLELLEELNLDTCRRIRSISEVSSLLHLRKLHLSNCGEIESLKPLENLSRLECVTFVESTNIVDGDISPLLHQQGLKRVSYQNRRHYSHRREDFGAAYFGEELWKQVQAGAKPPSINEMVAKALNASSRQPS